MAQDTLRTFGLDLGDRWTHICVLDGEGQVVERPRIETTPSAVRHFFAQAPAGRAAFEAGTHSTGSPGC